MSSAPQPTHQFQYTYEVFPNPDGTYTIGGGSHRPFDVNDVSDSANDDLNLLGDTGADNDTFHQQDANLSGDLIYYGETTDKMGIIGYRPQLNNFSLLTDVSQTFGNTIKVDQQPFALACYCTGTRIRTDRGEVAVEALQVGDFAVTTSGSRRPIR